MKRKMMISCLLLTMSLALSGCIKEQADRENPEISKADEQFTVTIKKNEVLEKFDVCLLCKYDVVFAIKGSRI